MNEPLNQFKDKKIAVIGEGLEGKSSVYFLEKHGAKVEIRDIKQGDDYLKDLNKFDLIIRSPGVRIDKLITYNSELIIPKITSQTKLFFDLCPAKVIGVTGTKGKGTTSTLIYEMLKAEGYDAYLGGNIGVPPLDFLDKLNAQSWVVLEMSSFQLQDLTKSPHIAVVLMITSEHLDYHKDVYEYIEAKRNIIKHQIEGDFAVINRDYIASNESDNHASGKVYFVSREREVEEGCFALGDQIWLSGFGFAASIERRQTSNVKPYGQLNRIPIIRTSELKLRGDHNQENVCSAVMAAYLAGVKVGTMIKVLQSFKGLEHRLELVDKINGVEYYNDSFSSVPETAIAAIQAFKEPEILLLGGSSKNSDFAQLGKVISSKENIKAIIVIGVEWERIKSKIKNQKSKIMIVEGAKDMKTIVAAAAEIAVPGDVVLLSPACASFDKFKNYKDRGNQFKEEVNKLKIGD